ncbi:hypothetical protein PYW08_016654 [Mythimna loreyi]|uniref:Uncharacterized protein n=1 Tax=Mythimna loreyi TaxID=667449 RepID=A0ACC2R2U6_9NEOP|nr:hypothetical protein PYW08_016654 [Mythimna loreyi]
MSYNPALSHYRRNNAPLTRYLPRTLTLQSMHTDFISKNPDVKCSIETYRNTMKSMKISLKYPKGDQCVDCGVFAEKIKNGSEVSAVESLQNDFAQHKVKAEKAIKNYKEDAKKGNDTMEHYFSMDLQKVTLLPDMPKIKDSFFLSRLVAFNLTFAPLCKDAKINSKCVVWHEAMMGRDANNIIDALMAFLISERDVKKITLWCDNCTGQNKNWFLFTALVMIVNSECINIDTITLRFLTKGHTHMSADGVHGNIEKEMRRRDGVYDYEDYKSIIANCRKNIDVIEVQKSYQWVKKKRVPRRNTNDDSTLSTFLLNPVVEAKFIK